MLARAARLCGLSADTELVKTGNERFIHQMGDERFLYHLEEFARDLNKPGAQKLVAGLRSRRIYQRIFKVGRKACEEWDASREPGAFCAKWRNGEEVEKLLCEVENIYELPHGTLSLWCSDLNAGMKLVRSQVVWESADKHHGGPHELGSLEVERKFSTIHKRVKMREEEYLDLWAFWINMDRDYIENAPSVIRTLEDRIGRECDPVFRETYLYNKIPGFNESWERGKTISRTMQKIEHKIEQEMEYQHSSLPLKNPEQDEVSILTTAKDVTEREILKKTSNKNERKSIHSLNSNDSQHNLFLEKPQKTEQSEAGEEE
jgi:hypothetical protein